MGFTCHQNFIVLIFKGLDIDCVKNPLSVL